VSNERRELGDFDDPLTAWPFATDNEPSPTKWLWDKAFTSATPLGWGLYWTRLDLQSFCQFERLDIISTAVLK
jgi:hypothetical protein